MIIEQMWGGGTYIYHIYKFAIINGDFQQWFY